MKARFGLLSLLLVSLLVALPSYAGAPQQGGHVSGTYLESRTADIYTGPCFANSEVNLTGQEAVLAWHIEKGTWGNVPLDGLSVTAVVRASATLGDVFSNPLPAKAVMIVDVRATDVQNWVAQWPGVTAWPITQPVRGPTKVTEVGRKLPGTGAGPDDTAELAA